MNQGTLTQEWDDYVTVLREDAHRLLAWGYADARSMLRTARDEYDLTGLLADAMDRRINNPVTPYRFSLYSIHNERPVSPAAEMGKDRPKLDIQIERCGMRPKPIYTFEAKRMRDDKKASASECLLQYLGDNGVGRFVAGKYERERAEAAMLGCVQAHTPEHWIKLIERAFNDDSANGRFNIVERFKPCSVIPEITNEGSTVHRRITGSTIRLLHILLSCT